MECHVVHCPAQKLLNNRRHQSEISLKCPFVNTTASETVTTATGTTKSSPELKKDTHQTTAGKATTGHQKLTHGCTSLMYACQRGDAGSIIRELRNKVSEGGRRGGGRLIYYVEV